MGGCLLNEINESAYPLAAEEIAADARTAVPGEKLTSVRRFRFGC
jgi:hypothetical protein